MALCGCGRISGGREVKIGRTFSKKFRRCSFYFEIIFLQEVKRNPDKVSNIYWFLCRPDYVTILNVINV